MYSKIILFFKVIMNFLKVKNTGHCNVSNGFIKIINAVSQQYINFFGTLKTKDGSVIDFTPGEGNPNTDFVVKNFTHNGKNYTFGLSTQAYYNENANGKPIYMGDNTFQVFAGKNLSSDGESDAGKWVFKWSITTGDGEVPDDLSMHLLIEGPNDKKLDSLLSFPIVSYNDAKNNQDPVNNPLFANQQTWGLYYSFMAPLEYDPNREGIYKITISIYDETNGVEINSNYINVNVVQII